VISSTTSNTLSVVTSTNVPTVTQHNIFKDPLFETTEYIQFKEAVAVATRAVREEDPQLTVIPKGDPYSL
jgi:hypothetical protein